MPKYKICCLIHPVYKCPDCDWVSCDTCTYLSQTVGVRVIHHEKGLWVNKITHSFEWNKYGELANSRINIRWARLEP